MQAINTCPENFLWEKNKGVLILVAPGLYQLSMGFYSSKQPSVKIYVNGEVIIHLKDKLDGSRKQKTKHSAGNVTGLTLVEFVALPARARVAISYEGETSGEGFFSLRKL